MLLTLATTTQFIIVTHNRNTVQVADTVYGISMGADSASQAIGLKQGIDSETAKKISKEVRDQGFKKVQVQIQGEELRVMSPSKDTLQEVMTFLRAQDFGVELKFGNYR